MKKKPLLFGTFLLSRGTVRQEDLHRALNEQRTSQAPLGQLALQNKFVTSGQLFRVLSEQRKRKAAPHQFGKIATELELMTEDQVIQLMKLQSDTRDFLGNTLVRIGVMDRKSLIRELKEYNALSRE